MKKDNPLKISIPNPCSQDWDNMPAGNGGRYCNKCTQIIHDFSEMPDKELLQYFKTNPATTCGRFHKHQLDRAIQPQKLRWSLPVYVRKVAAAFLSTLSFRTATAQIDKKVETLATTQTPAKAKLTTTIPDNITISGVITRGNNVPVANAKVSIDTLITVYTDMDGKFSVPLSSEFVTPHNLYFSCEGLERAVRTFHPLMGSTNYDVRLLSKEDYQSYFFIGLLRKPDNYFPSISFSKGSQILTDTNKILLEEVAEKLKDDPSIQIQLVTAYRSSKEKKLVQKQVELIQHFLINESGVGADRIKKTISKGKYVKQVNILESYD